MGVAKGEEGVAKGEEGVANLDLVTGEGMQGTELRAPAPIFKNEEEGTEELMLEKEADEEGSRAAGERLTRS